MVYLKFGITNKDVVKRLRQLEVNSIMKGSIIREYFNEKGSEVASLEKQLKGCTFEGSSCSRYLLPNGFTETVEYTPYNLNKLVTFFDNIKK